MAEMKFQIPDTIDERITQAIAGRVCTLPDGSYLYRSGGRSKSGRPPWYCVHFSTGEAQRFRARSDDAAVVIANAFVDRLAGDE